MYPSEFGSCILEVGGCYLATDFLSNIGSTRCESFVVSF